MNPQGMEDAWLNTYEHAFVEKFYIHVPYSFYEEYTAPFVNAFSWLPVSHFSLKGILIHQGNTSFVRTTVIGKYFLPSFLLSLLPFPLPSPFHLLILPFIKSDDHILATWAYKNFTYSMI